MKKFLKRLILLFAIAGNIASAQMDQLYMQKVQDFIDNGYPFHLLPGSEWRDAVIPVFVNKPLVGATYSVASNVSTIVFPTAHGLSANDGVAFKSSSNGTQTLTDLMCQIQSVPNSTTITVYVGPINGCEGGGGFWQVNGNSGSFTSGTAWKQQGPSMDQTVTWEILDHGTTAGKYFLRAGNARNTIAAGSPCASPDLHTATCYISHPVLTNAFPIVYIEVDPTLVPSCNMTGSSSTGTLVLNATIAFTLKATTTQTPAQTNSREYIVCQEGAGSGKPVISQIQGGYEQMFLNEEEPVYSNMFSTMDQYTIWSVVPDVGGGSDAWIETFAAPVGDTFIRNSGTKPEAVFHSGTVGNTGVLIKACADRDPTECTTVRRWISSAAPPSANPDLVKFSPCETDPVMTAAGGRTLNVGPGQTYADMSTLPNYSLLWGDMVIVHGESAPPGSPLSIPNFIEFRTPTNYASFATNEAVPSFYLCGKPNSAGELPIIEAGNAFTNLTNCSTFTCTHFQVTFNGIIGSSTTPYDGLPFSWHHIGMANLRLQNADVHHFYYNIGQAPPSGTQTVWDDVAAQHAGHGIRTFNIGNYTIKGSHFINDDDGILTDCNAHGGWSKCSGNARAFGNHFTGYGREDILPVTFPTEHAMYMQDWGVVMDYNIMDGSRSTAATGCFSQRASHSFFIGNRCVVQPGYNMAAGIGGNTELQDFSNYFNINEFYGPDAYNHGNCSNGSFNYPGCTPTPPTGYPAFGGMATYAAFVSEQFHTFFMIGNAIQARSGNGNNCTLSISMNHPVNGLELQHNVYYAYNTFDCPNAQTPDGGGQYWLETLRYPSGQSGNSYLPVDWPSGWYANNTTWMNDNTNPSLNHSFHGRTDGHFGLQTNVVRTGQFNPTATNIPLTYGGLGASPNVNGLTGLQQDARVWMVPGASPVEWRMDGWTSGNFIFASTKPYDNTTLAPLPGSPQIGAASALTYPLNLYTPLYNAIDANAVMTRRTSLTTAGAYDSGAPTVTTGFTLPAGSKLGHNSVMR